MASLKPKKKVNDLIAVTVQAPAVQRLVRRLERGGVLACGGVSRGAQPFLAALLQHWFPDHPVLAVTEGLKSQESCHQDLQTWLKWLHPNPQRSSFSPRLLFYPAWEVLPHEGKLPHVDVISERLETLIELSSTGESGSAKQPSKPPMVVTSITALMQRTFPPGELRKRIRCLTQNQRLDPLDLIEWLEDQGYEPEAQVNHKGEIALRGGILDLFPPCSPWPIRLEFFGDELESLRFFDPITQVSRKTIESVVVSPAGELGILKRDLALNPENPGPKAAGKTSTSDPSTRLATLLDYLPSNTISLFCEPQSIEEVASDYEELIPPGDWFSVSWKELQADFDRKGISRWEVSEDRPDDSSAGIPASIGEIVPASLPHTNIPGEPEATEESIIPTPVSPLSFSSLDAFRPVLERAPDPQVIEAQRREFFAQIHRWLRHRYTVHVFCNNEGERQRFGEIWADYGFSQNNQETVTRDSAATSEPLVLDRGLQVHLGSLSRGFIFEEARLIVVTDAEIFGRYKIQRPRRLKSPHAQTSRSLLDIDFTELEEGDYVVHLQHGIGRYLGLKILTSTPSHKTTSEGRPPSSLGLAGEECLVIEYAPRDPDQPPPRLYVPITEAHLVSKYVGAGKSRPPLNKLGGVRWTKAKAQAETAVRDLAGELLSIQASREMLSGHAFPSDTPWQREFEGAFLYEETPDQMRSIVQAKSDMELSKPMDRLICGDVGYGKTEVAIRAAFKAVMGGKQVAVLVPTTILAQQHFNTFSERVADYPIRVEMLSRFRKRREHPRIIRDLSVGAVDIVIGTHRLLQGDVAFKDLGLVVIDEEQRFGVLHKEKLKMMRQLVDVLTLSATPIPRTLYLALTGARDMSTIETPPQDRLPVETIVAQYDERIIRDAIQREINRGGQVFFLHNRVFDIDLVAQRLKSLVPKARLLVGHGQMKSDDLEKVMAQFINGDADVLLSTTIIESGIDIPNANTIIINRADRFGLSDLYQLRGRVGRYKHQAYAYLLIPRHAGLLSDARKRISAIRQYSSLGSGFKIAMRDLEIRGAGNLLGPQQSGHITAVGFDLYCQLLKQSIAVMKGEKPKPRVEVQVRLDFLALNPGEEGQEKKREQEKRKPVEPELVINVPRETAYYVNDEPARKTAHRLDREQPSVTAKASAYIPLSYIAEPRQRVELYRKLAEVTESETLEEVKAELRDRFGPLPDAVKLLLEVSRLKLLASERHITCIETRENKLMLTRNQDYVMFDDKFPRLMKTTPKARLNEIRKFILVL